MEKGDLDSKIKDISQRFKESGINKNLIDSLSTKIRKKLKEDNVKDMRDSFKNSKTPENKGLENPNDSGSESYHSFLSDDESSDDENMEAAKVKVKEMQEKAEMYKRAQKGLSPNVEDGPFSSDSDEEVTGGKVKGGKNRTQKRGKKRLNRTLKN